MRRHKHNLSHYKLLTGDMGNLIPIMLLEALPGDTFQQATSALIRFTPPAAPVMHPITVRIHHWFVPFRLLWDDWEDFITGGPDGTGAGTSYPVLGSYAPTESTLGDYLGIRPGVTHDAGLVSALPFRAYNLIWNEFYRDEDLNTVVSQDNTDIKKICWQKDYFTSSRPWAQKGPQVTLPLGTSAPVVPIGSPTWEVPGVTDNVSGLRFINAQPGIEWKGNPNTTAAGDANWSNPGLQTDLTNATAADVRDIRLAFALQRYQEARAQYGSRYTEYLRYLGIRPSDARLQRPEYLGGGKQTVAFSEVLRTGNNTDASAPGDIGQMRGHGIAAMRSNRYRYFCEEHGFIMSLMSVRPKTIYQDGQHKLWNRRTKEDYFQKELELIGQQEVLNSEVFSTGDDATDLLTFGYQNRYDEYRRHPSTVHGEFRTTLDYWHLARKFSSTPTLNGSFVESDPSKRIFQEQTQDSMWCMINHSVQARRMLGNRTIGRII